MNVFVPRLCCVQEPKSDEWTDDMDRRIFFTFEYACDHSLCRIGDNVVVVTGWRAGSGFTNTMRVVKVEASPKPIVGATLIGQ